MTESLSPAPKLTPMMEQYKSIKKTLPSDTILFFRLGDFYEMFFEDAVRASEILNITLTGREGGEAGRIPMCGVPYHSFQGYVRTLVDNNLKVAICEQIGDPKAGKGIVERRISRIISPATYLEDENAGASPEYMCAAVADGKSCAMAWLDLATGEFFVREMETERLQSELAILNPREVILPKTFCEDKNYSAFVKENLNASLSLYEDWVFEYQEGLKLIRENFKLASDKGLSFYYRPVCVAACGAILYYLRDHLHKALGHLRLPRLLDTQEFMALDRETLKSLELVTSMNGKKDGPTLLSCIDQTLTSMGSRALYQWVTQPLLKVEEIQKRQDALAAFIDQPDLMNMLRNLLKGVRDMERTLSRLNCSVANARDLVNLGLFLDRVPQLRQLAAKFKAALLKENFAALMEFPELKELIARSVVEAPPLGLKDGGMIRDGYSKDLDELKGISKNGKSWIMEFEKREIERTGIKSLKVRYSGVFGYTLEISKSNLNAVPPDYIRRQTLANAERFIVPELKEWDEKISGAEDKIKALEYRIFSEIREKVLEHLAPLQATARALGVLDAASALALTALQKNWTRPEVASSSELTVRGGRHPVVEAMLPFGQFVENDTVLDGDKNQLIVLTGPNMAGKSTYIRQVAQIVLLAQMGSYVPAAKARIGIVDRIFTRIGATDDLARGESTFMVEMLETAHILQSATAKSLLILDEVGRGTSTFDGVSIAWAICEYLAGAAGGNVRPRTLFATHYHELTQLEEHFPSIKNYNIAVRETGDGILFLRKVVRGGADRSYGIHVAQLAGIPPAVTKRAREILTILESENTEATRIIEGKDEKKKKDKSFQPAKSGASSSAARAEINRFQPSLFEVKVEKNPVIDEIKDLAVDNLSPLQALNKIAEWKKKLKD